ncbi:secreted RxLR effector protein 161-like [Gastrolobium bilobum]|uniref:secreted RxLR effector protein 161-like n=1 Tax=Gastrolobium bilobum TaxID=150636 RepID=UPI002AB23325|nr:secreted RxLR effector protein 161-like [Gastrolobium bilobum]
MEDPGYTHWKAAKRILRYVKGTISQGLHYWKADKYKLTGYSDNDWCGDVDDRKSTAGYVFFMGNTAFTWVSKKEPIVTLSTCEAEYVAASWCVCHAIWLSNLLSKLEQEQVGPTEIRVDNRSAIELAKNPVNHERSKHIDVRNNPKPIKSYIPKLQTDLCLHALRGLCDSPTGHNGSK